MGVGQHLNLIGFNLDRLLTKISHELLLLGVDSVPTADSPKHDAFYRKLFALEQEFTAVQRKLGQIDRNLLGQRSMIAGMRVSNDAFVNRYERHRAQQSIDSHSQHLNQVLAKARRVAAKLADLYGRIANPSDAEFFDLLKKLADEGIKSLENLDALAKKLSKVDAKTTAIVQSQQVNVMHQPPPTSVSGLLSAQVTFLILLLTLLRTRWR